jgi:hypothetical protein
LPPIPTPISGGSKLRGKIQEYGEEFKSPLSSTVFTSMVSRGEMSLTDFISGILIIKSPIFLKT